MKCGFVNLYCQLFCAGLLAAQYEINTSRSLTTYYNVQVSNETACLTIPTVNILYCDIYLGLLNT